MAVDFNIEIRKRQLESLDQFVTCSRDKVHSILESLGWSVDKIQEEQRLFVNCPHDSGHKVPAEKIEDHIENCKLKSAGYDLQEEFISEPVVHSEDSNIRIGTEKKIEILCQAYSQKPYFQTAWNGKDPDPLTYSRLFSTFSSDERLVLYDYCIANTRSPPELPEFDTSIVINEKSNPSFTKEDLLSFERDIKRRSVKYKPIHTNHKNYKEVLREVINSQMEQYNDWLGNVNGVKKLYRENHFDSKDAQEGEDESKSQEKNQEDVERPFSSVSKFSNSSVGSVADRHSRISKTMHHDSRLQLDDHDKSHDEYHSHYRSQSSRTKYKHNDEDSQESNSYSKVSSVDIDSSCENYEKAHSRDSSIHSSYRYREKSYRYKESRRRRSRSDSRGRRKRDHSSGSSRHSSRSHRSKEDKSRRQYTREKKKTH